MDKTQLILKKYYPHLFIIQSDRFDNIRPSIRPLVEIESLAFLNLSMTRLIEVMKPILAV